MARHTKHTLACLEEVGGRLACKITGEQTTSERPAPHEEYVVHEGRPSWHQARAGHIGAGMMSGFQTEEEAKTFEQKFKQHHPNEPTLVRKRIVDEGHVAWDVSRTYLGRTKSVVFLAKDKAITFAKKNPGSSVQEIRLDKEGRIIRRGQYIY